MSSVSGRVVFPGSEAIRALTAATAVATETTRANGKVVVTGSAATAAFTVTSDRPLRSVTLFSTDGVDGSPPAKMVVSWGPLSNNSVHPKVVATYTLDGSGAFYTATDIKEITLPSDFYDSTEYGVVMTATGSTSWVVTAMVRI